MPGLLRSFYGVVGGVPEVMSSHHRFHAPGEVNLREGGIVFCEARDRTLRWGVMPDAACVPDPPVMQWDPDRELWAEECPSLRIFLVNMACWQLVSAMPFVARFEASWAALKRMKTALSVVSATLRFHMACMVDGGAGVLASVLYDSEQVYLGGRSEQAVEGCARTLGVRLKWMTRTRLR